MGHAIFLRAVNVGGNTVKVRELADSLELVNIQAAGTFVCTDGRSASALGKAIAKAIGFPTEVIVCPAAELVTAIGKLEKLAPPAGAKRFVTVLAKPPASKPTLPILRPEDAWEVHVTRIEGPYVLSFDRKCGDRRRFYPNEVVEKALKVPGTTRGWDTITKVLEKLG
jgi:uncharacterized protein (DUF1697 family)